ncbi:exodeoxyribonuclease VII large subunit [Klebsiella pneumoniae subsp. pneumoniae]|nr:exodeoxyribonuclease VII large subunit [Klebsiella pneumoniae subsp. pneumoniae]
MAASASGVNGLANAGDPSGGGEPLSTLARGYSVTSVSDGTVLKQTKQVKTGDLLTTRA